MSRRVRPELGRNSERFRQVRLALPLVAFGRCRSAVCFSPPALSPLAGCTSSSFFNPPLLPEQHPHELDGDVFRANTPTRWDKDPGADNVTVIVRDGATIGVTNANALSLGDNAMITLGTSVPPGGSASNAPVLIQTTTNGGANGGQYGTGDNTIEFNENSTAHHQPKTFCKIATGTQTVRRAINPFGSGNHDHQLRNDCGGPSSAIFFENVGTSAASPRNSVDNFGAIDAPPGPNPSDQRPSHRQLSTMSASISPTSPAGSIKGNLDLQGETIP